MSKTTFYRSEAEKQAERFAKKVLGEGVNKRNVALLARVIDEPRGTVSHWLKNPHSMPLYAAIAIAQATGVTTIELYSAFKGRNL